MKKLFICLMVMFVSLSSSAQTTFPHLSFMGIPLNGTIDRFQAKLSAKGVYVNHVANKTIGVGCRVFKGSFSGKKADIYVYYNDKTKIVYRAKAVIEASEKEFQDNNYKYFESMLNAKYSYAETEKGNHDNHESISWLVPTLDENSFYKYLGVIDLYCSSYSYLQYSVHVDYTDTVNKQKSDNQNMDDL